MNLICTAYLMTTIWLPITTLKLNNVQLHDRACAAPKKSNSIRTLNHTTPLQYKKPHRREFAKYT